MKKLRLVLDRLKVESFSSSAIPSPRGTVRGHTGEATCGSCQTTINDVDCYQYSVYVACQEEAGGT